MTPVVSTEWLAAQRVAGKLLLFDASWYLPAERRDAHEQYRQVHLPGAQFFDIDAIADTQSSLPHMVPSTARFESLVGALGIANSDRIVFYDQRGLFSAARAWWLMRLFGHVRCAVLDGGLPRWQSEGRGLEHGEVPPPPGAQFQANFNARYLRGLGDMLDNLSSRLELVVDARSAERFHAQAPEPRAGIRGGHIPGSVNLPYTELLRGGQTLKDPAQLRACFAARGIDAYSRVVTCCGSGVSAAILNLSLEAAGWPIGALYDGSWAEWGSRVETPVEI